MDLFTPRSLLTWRKPLDASSGVSPKYLSTIYSQLTIAPFLLQTSSNDRVHFLFTRGRQVEEGDGLNGGISTSAPTVTVSYTLPYPSRTVLPDQPQGLREEAEGPP